MPAIAVVGALIAVAEASPFIAALAGGATLFGAAGIGLTGVLTITAAVGATVAAVGYVARDKGLQTAGMIMGAIGGLGAIANEAGFLGDTTSLFGGTATTGAATGTAAGMGTATAPVAGDVSPLASGGGAETLVDTAAIPGPPQDFISQLNSSVSLPDVGLPATRIPVETSALPDVTIPNAPITPVETLPASMTPTPTPTSEAMTPYDYAATQPGEQQYAGLINNSSDVGQNFPGLESSPIQQTAPDAANQSLAQQNSKLLDPKSIDPAANIAKGKLADLPDPNPFAKTESNSLIQRLTGIDPAQAQQDLNPTPSTFDKILNFTDKHQMATYGVLQVAGKLMDGFSPLTKAQVNSYNALAQANRATADETSQKVQNMQGNLPTARFRPTQPAPITGSNAPAGAGLINTGAVTGVPA